METPGPPAPPHLLWATRSGGVPSPNSPTWRHASARAVAHPALSGRARIAVTAEDFADAVPLLRQAMPQLGPDYRPFGAEAVIDTAVRQIPHLRPTPPFLWMETTTEPPLTTTNIRCRWLTPAEAPLVAALFTHHFPNSHAQPGRSGVHRWAGAYDDTGHLTAVAADAWSTAGCGFLAGVLTAPEARGRGLGAAVSRFVVGALVREYGRAALMVDADNGPAVATYERLGMTGHLFKAAAQQVT
ncbi:GCN5-related N-acetyltransferase [Actinobacteria bacterium OK074]|nr:GCN5-related N-acetyltransferase [Actinobacteria bacterium OK074]